MSKDAERFASQAVSLAGKERLYRAAKALEGCNATVTKDDVSAIERLSDAAIRAGAYETAVEGYALALRLRSETGFHPLRRADDEPST